MVDDLKLACGRLLASRAQIEPQVEFGLRQTGQEPRRVEMLQPDPAFAQHLVGIRREQIEPRIDLAFGLRVFDQGSQREIAQRAVDMPLSGQCMTFDLAVEGKPAARCERRLAVERETRFAAAITCFEFGEFKPVFAAIAREIEADR